MIEIFITKESFLKNQKIQEIKKSSKSELFIFNGDSDFQESLNALLTNNFFSHGKTIIYKDLLNKFYDAKLLKILEQFKEQKENNIYFLENKYRIPSSFKNKIESLAQVKEISLNKGFNLVNYIKELVQKEGAAISHLAAERLAMYIGQDLWRLSEEVKKLVNYKYSSRAPEEIDASDVAMLVMPALENNVFNLVDAFTNKNLKKAANLVSAFLSQGINEIQLFAMIARQFRNIAIVVFGKNITEKELVSRFKLHPFVAKKTIRQARNFDRITILKIYKKITEADFRLKSGADPELTLISILD